MLNNLLHWIKPVVRLKVEYSVLKPASCLLIAALSVFVFSSTSYARVSVHSIHVQSASHSGRLLINLSGKPVYYWFMLDNPERLVLDLKNAVYRKVNNPSLRGLPVKQIRWSKKNTKTVRMVFDLTEKVKPRVYLLHDKKKGRYQLELVFPESKAIPAEDKEKKLTPAATIIPHLGRDVVVVIDPGHGGKDPGAIGYHHYKEKNVVLPIAKDLADLLNKEKGIKASLTRTGDYFVTLRGRTDIARERHADLFISIHANSLRSTHARGTMIFALSRRGATSEMGRWIEHRENNDSLMGGKDGIDLSDKSTKLAKVLLDLSMANTLAHSMSMGKSVLSSLKSASVRIHSKKMGKAAFVVLKSPDIPSILVETGFITTPADARLLASNIYRHRFARGLKNGIMTYLKEYPPAGSWIAQKQSGELPVVESYKVKRGDTLSGIATRFNVSVGTLLHINKLKSARSLQVGQVIKVHGYRTYKVRAGDTLSKISSRFKVSVKKLIAFNRMKNGSHLLVGAQLKVPY